MSNIAINDAFADFEPTTSTTPAAAPAQVSLDDAFADFEAAPSPAPAREMTAEEKALTPGYYLQHGEPGLGRPSPGLFALADAGEGAILGATSGALEAYDLFAGEQEGGRPWLDTRKEEIDTHSPIIGPVSQGIGQFAIGIYGLGGVGAAVKLVPWFGRGLKAAEAALGATSKGKLAAELGRDAAAIYITSDPHTERLGNLLQNTTWGKPLGDFLASDPDDSVAEGRFKATLEGIGLDLALRGALLGSARVFKALWYGDAEEAAKLTAEAEAETRAAIAGPVRDVSAAPDGLAPAALDAAPLADDLAPTPRPDVPAASDAGGLEAPEPPRSGEAPSAALEAEPAPVPEAEAPRPPATVYEDTEALLGTVRADEEAIAKFGGYQAAADAGHQFGRGESIPYAKLNNTDDVNAFLARVVDAEEERIVTAKGGAVQHDADIERIAFERAMLFGDDPATFIGQMQGATEAAVQMSANAQAANIIVKRMAFDTIALARKLAAEDYAEFGGKLQAYAEFDRRRDILMALHASAGAIRSNVGRTLRLSGGRLAIDPAILDSIPSLDTERMIAVFAASDGTAGSIAKLTSPSLMAKVVDFGQTLLVNNLISGWTTALVNVLSNSYMVGARPLERILGAAPKAAMGDATSRAMVREATRQYLYTGTALIDGFRSAAKAFAANDSVLSPRSTELYRINQGVAQAVPGPAWKPWDSTANVLHNVFASIQPAALPGTAMKAIGVPTRVNGFLDEITKQTVYRSKVMARAHGDAVEEANRLGLAGAEARQFVREFVGDKLAKAFDANGMGVDQAARREAEIATFSQDLLPGTWGKTIQRAGVSHPGLRFILPFIKTPTNILRYGWKMTPGLNRLQAEHRAMLKGEMGAEMQAQAKGQVALGTLAMLSMASFVSMGTVTGGGPRDWKRRQELQATGWQPYSVVFENDDGTKRYVSYGRLDPIAIPLGIVADLQDAVLALGDDDADGQFLDKLGGAGLALGTALINQFTSKSYLTGLSQFLDAVQEPDTRLEPTLGRMASNFVPFASMLRQTDSDPYMRDAREFTDYILNTIPGLGEGLSPRYDAFGDPVLQRNGLWSTDAANAVDREMQRLALETGSTPSRPSPKARGGADLRDITMTDGEFAGRNAYEVYQELGGHLPGAPSLKELAAEVIGSEDYQLAPDGDAGTEGTKLSILTGEMSRYRREAMEIVAQDSAVSRAMSRKSEKVEQAYRERGAALAAGKSLPATGRPSVGEAFGVVLGDLFGGGEGQAR